MKKPARRRGGRLATHHGVLFTDAVVVPNLQVMRIAPAAPAMHESARGARVRAGNITARPFFSIWSGCPS
jgi:hypothetical protein